MSAYFSVRSTMRPWDGVALFISIALLVASLVLNVKLHGLWSVVIGFVGLIGWQAIAPRWPSTVLGHPFVWLVAWAGSRGWWLAQAPGWLLGLDVVVITLCFALHRGRGWVALTGLVFVQQGELGLVLWLGLLVATVIHRWTVYVALLGAVMVWGVGSWWGAILWGVAIGLAVVEWRIWRARAQRYQFGPVNTMSVVIPTKNAGAALERCLSSIQRGKYLPSEIIIVDGGSDDNTLEVAEGYKARIFNTEPGRGQQIAHGVKQATGDLVLVLHADASVTDTALGDVVHAMNEAPHAVGGAMGQQFDAMGVSVAFIGWLNDIKAGLGGLSFGDQGQFFRRALLQKRDLVPVTPLMEDVALAINLQCAGPVIYLWSNIKVSSQKWEAGFSKRFALVIDLVGRYLLRRLRGQTDTNDLYSRYYK